MDGILLHPSDGRAYSLSEPGFPIRSRCLLGEPADFFSLQRHKLVLVVLVELRTEIQRVDTGIISVHYEKVPRFSKQAVSLYDLSFGRGLRDPQLIPRLA